ncbi:hypothetical protein VCJ_000557 [Vibrio metoecus]|nr:hypothetical protein VCJ_000557 [Vibrio metoecus]
MKHRDLIVFNDVETTEYSTLSTKSASEKLESQVLEFER